MNKRQKQVLQSQLNSESKTIKDLKQIYAKASEDVEAKIRELSARSDMENLQSIIYQKQYQEALKKQIDATLDMLHSNEFTSVQGFLATAYTSGYIGTMYDIAGQGIPLVIPIDQKQVVEALQTDSKISTNLYTRLGEDVKELKNSIRSELSRGIAQGMTWNDIAVHVAKGMKSNYNKAYNNAIRISRTEGHRIQTKAALDAQHKAKEKGADIVKQWDATLDGSTRKSHRKLDGQIRELDEDFEVDGKKAKAPGHFGDPAEDCNCRCAILQRARCELDESELETLKERAEYFGLDKTKDFEEYKEKYLQASKLDNSVKSSTINDNSIRKGIFDVDIEDIVAKDDYSIITDDTYDALIDLHSAKVSKEERSNIYGYDWNAFQNLNMDYGYINAPSNDIINMAIREDNMKLLNKKQKKTVEHLKNAISKNTVDENYLVERYVGSNWFADKFSKKARVLAVKDDFEAMYRELETFDFETTITDKQFVSCSMNNNNVYNDRKVKLIIEIPKGTNALVTENRMESELIMYKPSYRIKGIREGKEIEINNKKHKQLEILLEVVEDKE